MPSRLRPYILTRRNLNLTSRLLARELGLVRRYEVQEHPPAIRWGNSDDSIFSRDTMFNNPQSISLVANKLRFSRVLEDAGIEHVLLRSGEPTEYPVVVRTTLGGSRGEGIVLCRNSEEFRRYSGNWWTRWYNFRDEYGVHVLGGNIVKVFRKVWSGEDSEPEFPLKNTNRGYRYSLVSMEGRFSVLAEYIRNIHDTIPINMCRYDVGFDSDERVYRVIEGNTAPGLSENDGTRALYVNYLMQELGGAI